MNINFTAKCKLATYISLIFCILSFFFIFINKFNFGLEFIGGIEFEIEINNKNDIYEIKKLLTDVNDFKIRYYGSNKNIQLKFKFQKQNSIFITSIEQKLLNKFKITKISFVSSEINNDTLKNTFIAIFLAFFFMFFYLFFRFDFILGVSAIITLLHDILLVLGFISILKIEFNLISLSAIFAVFGYSVNDTVVIFDRIREIKKINNISLDLNSCINLAINKTLSRTLMTSGTTLFVTIILLFFSGENLFDFSLILSFGIIVGTYSSMFISVYPLLFLKKI